MTELQVTEGGRPKKRSDSSPDLQGGWVDASRSAHRVFLSPSSVHAAADDDSDRLPYTVVCTFRSGPAWITHPKGYRVAHWLADEHEIWELSFGMSHAEQETAAAAGPGSLETRRINNARSVFRQEGTESRQSNIKVIDQETITTIAQDHQRCQILYLSGLTRRKTINDPLKKLKPRPPLAAVTQATVVLQTRSTITPSDSLHTINTKRKTFKMPSQLRLQSSFEPISANASYQTSPTFPPSKKQKMSLTQTYFVASTARSKLGREAARADHNLRRLVGHANLLDTLMVELADAEREQEAWFNQSVQKASKPQQPRHIQWIDSIEEEPAEEEFDDESDADSEIDDDDDVDMFNIPLRRLISPPLDVSSTEVMEVDEDEEDSDDEYDEEHSLTRVTSNHSPPELTHEADSDSEDESMPPSPEHSTFELSEKERQVITTTSFYEGKSRGDLDDYIMQQSQSQSPLIAAC
nr:hypothetical protein CFP56_16252 [Quercus suber]